MKKSLGFRKIISIFLVVNMLAMPVFAQTEPTQVVPEVTVDTSMYGCFSMDATDAFLGDGQLIKNAKSVFLYELTTQTLMYAWEADAPLVPSSFVKILTAIIAIENANLDSAVTISESAIGNMPIGAVSAKLVANEVMTMRDLIYCMMVGSANDAAAVIACHVAGNESAFAGMMNEYASRIGCTGSCFVNPHGLEDADQVMTARDAAKILAYAMENETFRTIFTTIEYNIPATNKSAERYLITGNHMISTNEMQIYFDERVIGGRTGVANDGTRSLATIAKYGNMELLCIVMGAASVYEESGNKIRSFGGYNETKAMLDSGFDGYMAAQIISNGQALVQFDINNGDTVLTAGPRVDISSVLPVKLDRNDLTLRYTEESRNLLAPIQKDERVCGVEIWYKDLCLAVTDIYAMNEVRDTSPVTKEQPQKVDMSGLIVLICFVVLIVLCGLFFLRNPKGRRIINKLRRRIKKARKPKRSA